MTCSLDLWQAAAMRGPGAIILALALLASKSNRHRHSKLPELLFLWGMTQFIISLYHDNDSDEDADEDDDWDDWVWSDYCYMGLCGGALVGRKRKRSKHEYHHMRAWAKELTSDSMKERLTDSHWVGFFRFSKSDFDRLCDAFGITKTMYVRVHKG